MNAKKQKQQGSNPPSTSHIITVTSQPPVAVATPPILKVSQDDDVTFLNKTCGTIDIRMAAKGVLKGLGTTPTDLIDPNKSSGPYKVLADKGTHEISIHYQYMERREKGDKERAGFALGGSSPKVVVTPPFRKKV